MTAPKILVIAGGLIDVLTEWELSGDKDGKLAKRRDELRAAAREFPSAEVLRRLEKAYQLFHEGQLAKGKKRLEEARLLAERLAAKIRP